MLVWQDMAGLSARSPKFAKRYADVAATLRAAATEFAADVAVGRVPDRAVLLPVTARPQSKSTALVFRTVACSTWPGRRVPAGRANGLAGLSLEALGQLRAVTATLGWLAPMRVLSGGRTGEHATVRTDLILTLTLILAWLTA